MHFRERHLYLYFMSANRRLSRNRPGMYLRGWKKRDEKHIYRNNRNGGYHGVNNNVIWHGVAAWLLVA